MASDRTSEISEALPYLRRYARALTGSQASGDHLAAATLEALLETPGSADAEFSAKVMMFRAFHNIWTSKGAQVEPETDRLRAAAQAHLSRLTANTREALLLKSIEGFSHDDIGTIMNLSEAEAAALVDQAHHEMTEALAGKIMIIEDETIIALDLQGLVNDMGHQVTGIARTQSEALQLAAKEMPDLILADIQLADNSSGIDAVKQVMGEIGRCPVIFITAFPERLLSGDPGEPAFLIAKPYTTDQVQSAVSQAMFFASTETLTTEPRSG